MRCVVLGAGGLMAQAVYLPLLAADPGVELTALVDTDRVLADRVSARYSVPTMNGSTDPPDADVTIVLTPPWTHAELVKRSLGRGSHVLVEKPLALDPGEARSIVADATSAGLHVAVGYMKRYDRLVQEAAALLARHADGLGSFRGADLDVANGAWGREAAKTRCLPPTDDGPADSPPADLGVPAGIPGAFRRLYFRLASQWSHDLNLVRSFSGELSAVSAAVDTSPDGTTLSVELAGPGAPIRASFRQSERKGRWRETLKLNFEHGRLELDLPPPLIEGAPTDLRLQVGADTRSWTVRGGLDPFARQLEAFLGACRGTHEPLVPVQDAVADIDLAASIVAVAASGSGR